MSWYSFSHLKIEKEKKKKHVVAPTSEGCCSVNEIICTKVLTQYTPFKNVTAHAALPVA